MPVSPLGLSIVVTENSGCSGLTLTDTTGVYGTDGNVTGYGVSGGPAVNDVVTVTVTLNYRSFGSTIVYVFTVASGTITAATLSLGGATPVDIFDNLPDTAWPFDSDHPFDLTADYGVTLPTFGDDIYLITYQIEGSVGLDDFDFSTIYNLPVTCALQCCADKRWADIDPTCGCSDTAMQSAMKLQSLIYMVGGSAAEGKLTAALNALEQAQLICNAEDCGC